MQIHLSTRLLTREQRKAVYAALFATAYADEELHSKEMSIITNSLGNPAEMPLSDRVEVSEVIRENTALEKSLDTLSEAPGELLELVTLIMLDIIAADNIVCVPEIEAASAALSRIILDQASSAILEALTVRIDRLRELWNRENFEPNTWLMQTTAELNARSAARQQQLNVSADPDEHDVGIEEHSVLRNMLQALKEQKRKRRLNGRLNEFGDPQFG